MPTSHTAASRARTPRRSRGAVAGACAGTPAARRCIRINWGSAGPIPNGSSASGKPTAWCLLKLRRAGPQAAGFRSPPVGGTLVLAERWRGQLGGKNTEHGGGAVWPVSPGAGPANRSRAFGVAVGRAVAVSSRQGRPGRVRYLARRTWRGGFSFVGWVRARKKRAETAVAALFHVASVT